MKRYAVYCEFCGRVFYITEPPEPDTGYICPDCTEEFRREV